MDNTQVNIRINATDASKSAVKEARSGFAGLWKQIGGGMIAANLAFDALNKVKEGVHEVVNSGKEWQSQQAALDAALASTHDISGISREDAIEYAEALSKATPISREIALAGENMLLTFTNIHKNVFPQTTKAVADMATAMNHGLTPSASDLTHTSIMVGKALNDPEHGLTRLMRVGVQFTDQQKKQIKTLQDHGKTAEAQKVILDELSKEFGGRATASAKTFQGQMTMLKNKLVDMGVNGLQKVTQWLKDSYQWYQNHRRVVNDVISVLAALGLAILAVITVFNLYRGAVAIINTVKAAWLAFQLLMETNPIVIIITLIIAAGILLMMHWKQVKEIGSRVFHDIGGFISSVWNWIKSHWPLLLGILTGPIGLAVVWVISHFGQILSFFKGLPGKIKSAVGDLSHLLVEAGKDLVRGLINGIKNIGGEVGDAIKGVAQGAVDKAKSILHIKSPSQVFAEIGTNIGAGLIQGIQGMQQDTNQAMTQLVTPTIGTAPSIANTSNINSSSISYGNRTQSVNIQNLVMPPGSTLKDILRGFDQDNLLISNGLSPSRGAGA